MEPSDDIICNKFLQNTSINPRTGKNIKPGTEVYNSLIKLCISKKFDVSHLSQVGHTAHDTEIPKIQINLKSTKLEDLLELYLKDSNFKYLDNKAIINKLNTIYNIKIETNSFIEWFKYYNYITADKSVKYLYDLERIQYVDSEYINDLLGNKFDIKDATIRILLNWLWEVKNSYNLSKIVYCYACTLFFIVLGRKKSAIVKSNLQMYGILCLYYAELLLNDRMPKFSDYVHTTDKAFSTEEMKVGMKDIFTVLDGQLIYSSPIFFIDFDNSDLVELTILVSSITSLSFYKPSLVAHTCIYMVTGEHDIYAVDEMTPICQTINSILQIKYNRKSLYKDKTEYIRNNNVIKHGCGIDIGVKSQILYQYNEPWHLGSFENIGGIGEGTFGAVSRVKRKTCGLEYALKASKQEDRIDNFILEISMLKLLSSDNMNEGNNVISVCGYIYDIDKITVVLPLLKGSLYHLIRDNQINKLKYPKYFKQILLGIEQIHDHDIIHRDIKALNILYDEKNDNMLIIDFGISVCYQSFKDIYNTNAANSLPYRPPECLAYPGINYGKEIDIWAVGCVFYYMIMKKDLVIVYVGDYDNSILNSIFNVLGFPTNETWPGIEETLGIDNSHIYNPYALKNKLYPYGDLVLDCLTMNPDNRLTVYELLIHYDKLLSGK
jgi:hypothetical protein